jgi:hypothetical protein
MNKTGLLLIASVAFITFLLHVVFENSRWQLYPLYLSLFLCFFIVLGYFFLFKSFRNRKLLNITTLLVTGVLILISGISSFSFPIYEIAIPTGDYLIGTQSFVLIDSERMEQYGTEGNRKIRIQMWYPAETVEEYENVPWLEDGKVVAQSLAQDMGLPRFVLDHTELIMSNSYQGAPISETLDEYPVVVISHGWRGFRNLHTDLAEELASLGYIVVNIDHTYGSVATVFSDEETAYLNLDALPNRETNTDFLDYANTLVNTYAGDITLTLDELEKMDAEGSLSMFEGKMDVTKIGLLGHSTGGGADVAVAINDERVKALVGMDAWVEPIYDTEIEKGLDVPALFLRSGSWEIGENNLNLNSLVESNADSSWLYQIDGITHYDFSMAYMYSPLTKYISITGELDGDYLVSILKTVITEFFDKNLKENFTIELNQFDETWEAVRRIK